MQNLSVDSQYLIQNLPTDQQFILAQTLISFASISFAIFFGLAALSRIKSLKEKDSDSHGLWPRFPQRFLRRLNIIINSQIILLLLSISFFIVSLLSLLYFKSGNAELLLHALNLIIYTLIFTILFIFCLIITSLINALPIPPEEIDVILGYAEEINKQQEDNKTHKNQSR